VFIVEMFIENGDSVVKSQWIFCRYFNIAYHRKIPCHSTIQLWVESFRTSPSALQKKPPGRVCEVWSPQNIKTLMQSFSRNPRCSATRKSVALGISEYCMRRILSEDLNFHPYRMLVVQGLNDHQVANHSTTAEHLIWILSNNVIIPVAHEAHLHLSGCINK
jgi:hypothetical protein